MKEVSTIGLDLAKNVFQVHGVDAAGPPRCRTRPSDRMAEMLRGLERQLQGIDKQIVDWGRGNTTCRHL